MHREAVAHCDCRAADSPFLGKPRLVKNYNGIVTTYEYSRDEAGTSQTTIERTGKPLDFNSDPCIVNAGTETTTITATNGVALSRISQDIVSQKTLVYETAEEFDAFNRVTTTLYRLDGSTSTTTYGCCGPDNQTDREGVVTVYEYDPLNGRLKATTRDGIKTEDTDINANGDTLTQTVYARGGGIPPQATTYTYTNGRMTSSTAPLGRTTNYTYSSTVDTTTFPDGSKSEVNYNFGVQSGTSGSAVHSTTLSSGPLWSKTLPANVTTRTNLLGQSIETTYADSSKSLTEYNPKGQVITQTSPAGIVTQFEYDDLGRPTKSTVVMTETANIVTQYLYDYSLYSGKNVSSKTTIVSQGAQSKTVSTEYASLDGLDSWTVSDGRVNHTSAVYATDSNNRRTGSKTVTQTRYAGSTTVSKTVSTYLNGRVLHVENFNADNSAGNTLDYAYDGFNRLISVTEQYNGAVINTTETVYDAANQPVSVTRNSRVTANVFDNMGRLTSTTLPGERTVHYEYFMTGELKKTYGAETYTQALTYTDQGNKASLTTYRSGSDGDTTTWTYNSRNFMTAKTYADGKSIHYTYDADGRLLSRVWARGITTSYTYDHAGRQTAITYSDGTPGIALAYDYLNRLTTATQGTETRTFTYNADSTVASETIPYIVNGSLAYSYDDFGRRTGMTLNQNSSAVYSNSYAYDVQGRIATVSDGTNTATYSRVPGTNLLSSTTITQGGVTKLTKPRRLYSS